MQETNGAVAPDDGATPTNDAVIQDGAIDAALDHTEQNPVDTARLKAEQDNAELRFRLRAQEERIADLVRTSTAQSEMLSELVGGMRDAKDRGFAYEAGRLRSAMRKAVADADQASYDAAERDLWALMGSQKPAADAEPKPDNKPVTDKQQRASDPVAEAWVRDNPWFNTDAKLKNAAIALDASLQADYPDTATRLAEVKKELARTFPDKFANPARSNPPAVSRSGPQATARSKPKAKTKEDLPPSARIAMERYVKQGTLTEEQYLKDYFTGDDDKWQRQQ